MDDLLTRLQGFMPRLLSAVRLRDYEDLTAVYEKVQRECGVPGGHAMAVALAETLLIERERHRDQLVRVNAEATRFAEAYNVQRAKVQELRDILDRRAGEVPAQRGARAA